MISKLPGFTLIELIVVVSIMLLVGSSGTLYFFGFVESQEAKAKINIILDKIDTLDRQIQNYELFDYTVTFSDEIDKNKSVIIEKNVFDTPYTASPTINDTTGELTLSLLNGTNADTWEISVYKEHKIGSRKSPAGDDNINMTLDQAQNYHIYSQISPSGTNPESINSIHLTYFEELDSERTLELIGIYTDSDLTNGIASPIQLINTRGKKSFSPDPGVTSIYLVFDYNGQEIATSLTLD